MNYSELKTCDIADGPGVRVSLFVSGCHFHCKGCHNAEAWDFKAGTIFGSAIMRKILDALNHPWIDGFTILGGEPFAPENAKIVFNILHHIREELPEKTIWAYSGYTYEELIKLYPTELSDYVDVLVDGPYIEELRDISLRFRGSSNQRIISICDSASQGRVVLWDPPIEHDPMCNTTGYISQIEHS